MFTITLKFYLYTNVHKIKNATEKSSVFMLCKKKLVSHFGAYLFPLNFCVCKPFRTSSLKIFQLRRMRIFLEFLYHLCLHRFLDLAVALLMISSMSIFFRLSLLPRLKEKSGHVFVSAFWFSTSVSSHRLCPNVFSFYLLCLCLFLFLYHGHDLFCCLCHLCH